MRRLVLLVPLLCACGPWAGWPEPTEVFPWVYTAEADVPDWARVRWETGDWTPASNPENAARYLLKSANHWPSGPVEVLDHFDAMRPQIPRLGQGVRLSFVGDVMWVGDRWDRFALPAAPLLDGALRIGNLETPTSPDHPTSLSELGLYTFNAPPEILDGLPLDLLQLTNNHTLDVGDDGLEATLAEVEARGYAHAGIDAQAVVEVDGLRVAVLAYTWGLNDPTATSVHDLHIVPFGHTGPIDLGTLAAEVAAARTDADAVVTLLHWGYEFEYHPDPHFLQLAREIVAAGADVVVGSGPHVAQPVELCQVNRPEVKPGIGTCSVRTDDGVPRTAAVLYSLGNFGSIMATTPCRVGLVATVSLDPDVTGLGWAGAVSLDGPELVPLDDALDDPDLAAESDRLDAHLGSGWRR